MLLVHATYFMAWKDDVIKNDIISIITVHQFLRSCYWDVPKINLWDEILHRNKMFQMRQMISSRLKSSGAAQEYVEILITENRFGLVYHKIDLNR